MPYFLSEMMERKCCGGVTPNTCKNLVNKGYIKATKYTPDKPQLFVIQYLSSGTIKDIEEGRVTVKGYSKDGGIVAENLESRMAMPKTQWNNELHDARDYGTKILKEILGEARFDFPKSLYAVRDCLKLFTLEKPNAIIIDFFAGSGTTMHAVNLLNAEDGGHRRCIMVTNNEVSADETKMLKDKGYQPGDEEWEKLGIAHYVTWPRTVCSIEGHDVNGKQLKGDYLGSEPPMHMSDGFRANVAFFKLGFLNPTAVSLGMRFSEMLPTLWLKTGAKGKCPELSGKQVPDMLILPENQFAVLINENTFANFAEKLAEHPEIQTVFLATDYEVNYQSMVKNLNVTEAYQLYRDYLDHFRVNRGRN
ncbi:MAG: DNA methyltransferase [Phascolarctobacterium succinatutens]|uniref:DNA methyltransferase n=1 Tax=Phascolarctobacterium succinatutens TaxID=626940 RepID=UPI003994D41A